MLARYLTRSCCFSLSPTPELSVFFHFYLPFPPLEHDCKGVGALKGVMRTESQLAAIIVFVLALTVFAAETPHHNDRTDHSSPTRSTVDRDTYLYQGPTITPINTHIIFLVHDCGGSSHFQQQWHWAFLPSPWKSGC